MPQPNKAVAEWRKSHTDQILCRPSVLQAKCPQTKYLADQVAYRASVLQTVSRRKISLDPGAYSLRPVIGPWPGIGK